MSSLPERAGNSLLIMGKTVNEIKPFWNKDAEDARIVTELLLVMNRNAYEVGLYNKDFYGPFFASLELMITVIGPVLTRMKKEEELKNLKAKKEELKPAINIIRKGFSLVDINKRWIFLTKLAEELQGLHEDILTQLNLVDLYFRMVKSQGGEMDRINKSLKRKYG